MTAILEALRRLDSLLGTAADRVTLQKRPQDSFRGLYIDPQDIAAMLQEEPASPRLWTGFPDEPTPGIEWLQEAFELSPFDMDLVLLALAPELDLRYERLYAYLQDDVTRRRPTVDLALNLLCATPQERIERRAHFAHESPLRRHEVIRLVADPSHVDPPLLSHYLRLDEQILCVLLEQPATDPRLATCCRWAAPLRDGEWPDLRKFGAAAKLEASPLRLYLQGPDRQERESAAAAIAAGAEAPLLVVDLAQASPGAAQLVAREAWLRGAILYAEGVSELPECLVRIAILGGSQPGNWQGALTVRLNIAEFSQRIDSWRECLEEAQIDLSPADRSRLASGFVLTRRQIQRASAAAAHHAALRGAASPAIEDVFAASRAESGHALAALARKITPKRRWSDIVLPADLRTHLHELCRRASLGRRVLDDWGFNRRLSSGKGVSAVFAGPSGTGKTLAAEIVAAELRLDLFKIELSGVVSKYIGETEKNLDRIFSAAENANAILFFDEADALFGKRSEVRDSHDRYANIEVAYLLQKMEEYEGIAILATNLRQHLDDSFTRRLTFCLQFPFPDENSRRLIWEGVWPPETPIEGVDLDFLARRLKLSGGNIRNIALAAAFLAADEESPVNMDHLMQAARREFQKLGKQLTVADLQMEAAS